MPNLHDPNFERGVAIICQHGEDGTMGIMVNRLSDYRLGDVLAQMSLRSDLPEVADAPVLIGGPVQPERGFVLHREVGDWESSYRINDEWSVTTSRDILVALAGGEGPRQAVMALGYAGVALSVLALLLPSLLAWRSRQQHPDAGYRVKGGKPLLVMVFACGIAVILVQFSIATGLLPEVG